MAVQVHVHRVDNDKASCNSEISVRHLGHTRIFEFFSRSVLWALTGPRGLVIVSQMMSAVLLITFPRIELRMYEYLQHGRVAINSLPRHAASLVWHGACLCRLVQKNLWDGAETGSNCFNHGFVMHVIALCKIAGLEV